MQIIPTKTMTRKPVNWFRIVRVTGTAAFWTLAVTVYVWMHLYTWGIAATRDGWNTTTDSFAGLCAAAFTFLVIIDLALVCIGIGAITLRVTDKFNSFRQWWTEQETQRDRIED